MGNTNHGEILFYRALGSAQDGGGTFILPDGYGPDGWGTDYFVYILAENICDPLQTDYAGVPVRVDAPER